MAERRMFTKKISDSDDFTSLSSSAQALYFHLNQGADDDGFNNQIQQAMFKAHASQDDLKVLLAKNFILRFDSGVIVIKHWRMHNALRKDRYKPTAFQEEFLQLSVKENGAYTLGCQVVANWLPQVRIGKEMISENINNITTHVRVREYLQNALDMLDVQKRVMTQLYSQEAAEEYENVFGIVVELCQDKDFADKLLVSDDSFLHRCAVEFANGTVSDKVGYIKMSCERAKRIR